MNFVWNNAMTTCGTMFGSMLTLGCVTAYQALQIFGYKYDEVFLPYTSFFMYVNFLFASLGTYYYIYEDAPTVNKVVKKFFPDRGETGTNKEYDTQVFEMIEAQRKDDFQLTKQELSSIITVHKIEPSSFEPAIGKNDLSTFQECGKACRVVILILLGVVATGFLVLNAMLI
jgi:hypothetical protein